MGHFKEKDLLIKLGYTNELGLKSSRTIRNKGIVEGQISFYTELPILQNTPAQLPEVRKDNRSKVVTETVVQTGLKIEQNGFIKSKDYYVIRFNSKGEPRYKEEMDRIDNIWAEYINKREFMNSNGDYRNIFLIPKGRRVEGIGKYRYISGKLTDDVLAVIKPNSKNLNTIYSFSNRGNNIFNFITESIDENGNKRILAFSRKADILAYNDQINLDRLKKSEDFKTEMQKRLTKKG